MSIYELNNDDDDDHLRPRRYSVELLRCTLELHKKMSV